MASRARRGWRAVGPAARSHITTRPGVGKRPSCARADPEDVRTRTAWCARMDCPACGAPATEGRFCARCGAALIQRCPGCSRDNPAGAVFCSHCGTRLADEPGAAAAPVATPAGPARSEGERRQLTVLFCDLVDSTALSAVLDPEDMRAVITAYQSCCAAVVERFEGHLAKYMGDGVLAYFGYPQAHEGDPERAVRAGLELIEAIAALAPRPDLRLEARIGIATGLVVVGDLIGDGSAKEQAVVGETPNLAARLQALAEPGSVVISPRTRRLIGGLFDCEDLGEHQLKGFAGPVELTRVVAPRRVGRFEALRATEPGADGRPRAGDRAPGRALAAGARPRRGPGRGPRRRARHRQVADRPGAPGTARRRAPRGAPLPVPALLSQQRAAGRDRRARADRRAAARRQRGGEARQARPASRRARLERLLRCSRSWPSCCRSRRASAARRCGCRRSGARPGPWPR